MRASDVRRTFLDYFQENDHERVSSSSVIPQGDRSLLFTNAGMNQFKDLFTGKKRSKRTRATTAQKCIRAGGKHNDLDNVGYTTRHLTFFEMLGNFSFGDYFKKEAIGFAWELVTRRFGVSPERLWITVFHEDDEARSLWRQVAGVADDRIVGLGEKDNFWSMGEVGPCGPCSEILFDRGDAYGAADIENGERFFEIWNLVFMQYDQSADGTRKPLPRPSIDTGMGLERMAMVLQDVHSVFETDLFQPLIQRVETISGAPYDPGPPGVPHRVLADHVRCLVFAFADGAEPSNEGQGYVLRRILRRAARYARKIHVEGPLLHRLVEVVIEEMGEAYPEIRARERYITEVIRSEEERFGETLDNGIQRFEEVVARMRDAGQTVIPGDDAFVLYDTFGFPIDLVEQMADEISFDVDVEGFERRMEEQKERSRGASRFTADALGDGIDLASCPETRFVGYETETTRAKLQLASEREGAWRVILSETPFYGESGGQVGDTGTIRGDSFLLRVEDTQKDQGRTIHVCRLEDGDPSALRSGAEVEAAVDRERRSAIRRNHTATHLLHAALRQVAGSHVHQKGSLVEPSRLRFDVTHFSSFSREELERAERIVREQILANHPVETFEATYEEALDLGAMALFGEKYGDRVRVVRIGDISTELCGGTHVSDTAEIGPFLVVGEGSVSAGVRRLEAVTADGAQEVFRGQRELLEQLSRLLKVPPESLGERIEKLLEENRQLRSKRKAAGPEAGGDAAVRRWPLGNAVLVSGTFPEVDGKELRELHDRYKREGARVVVVLFAPAGPKMQVLIGVTRELVDAGVDARKVLQAGAEILGARGGGRPELVQAGASGDSSVIPAALDAMRQTLERLLGGKPPPQK